MMHSKENFNANTRVVVRIRADHQFRYGVSDEMIIGGISSEYVKELYVSYFAFVLDNVKITNIRVSHFLANRENLTAKKMIYCRST